MASRILVADDSSTIQKIIKITLSSEDFELFECVKEQNLNSLVAEHKPDLVLLDFNLSENKTGYDLANEIREEHPAKIIILFGTFDTIDQSLLDQININGHIVKPFDPSKFITLCRNVIELQESADLADDNKTDPVVNVGDEWVVNQPEVIEEEETPAEETISEEEKNQLEAGIEDWGMVVPGVIDGEQPLGDLPPVIGDQPLETSQATEEETEESVSEEEETSVPSDSDLEYPDADEIIAQVASEPEPKAQLVPLEELSEDPVVEEENSYPDAIGLDETSGTSTLEEIEALEEQIADEEDDGDLWSADEVMDNPDKDRKTEPQVPSDSDGRRKEDSSPQINRPTVSPDIGDKTDPMINIFRPENLNEEVTEKIDPVMENIVKEEVEKRVEKALKEEVQKRVDAVVKQEVEKAIEKIAWEVIPDLAENLIKNQLSSLADKVLQDE